MTSAALTRLFIGGATARTPFMSTSEGRIKHVNGETMSPEDLVTPILTNCHSTDSNQGLVVSVNDKGAKYRAFRSILTENSELYEQGERRTDWFCKMTLAALLEWVDVSPRGTSTDVAACALQLFPREPALRPLPSVVLRKLDGRMTADGWVWYGDSRLPELFPRESVFRPLRSDSTPRARQFRTRSKNLSRKPDVEAPVQRQWVWQSRRGSQD